jgi:anaerobic magnesium-protoporphyrin IX monomethyl ester cyclase
MRVLLVNLPAETRLMRRYVASYYAPNFLVPPVELMGLGAIASARPGCQVRLLDCVAEELDLPATVERARRFAPDVVVTMTGFAVCGDDLQALGVLGHAVPGATTLCFGHLPTELPAEVMALGRCDGILLGEPELTFADVLDRIEAGEPLDGVPGLVTAMDGKAVRGPARGRIEDLDALPWPDHGLVPLEAYRESFMPRPVGAIMSSRGCPHGCTFCVRTFGRELKLRSAPSIAAEVDALAGRGIGHVRFLDDTFTVDRQRVIDICGLLPAPTSWTALARLQDLDEELLGCMAAAGCRRLYVGVESGSQRILDRVHKGVTLEEIRTAVGRIKRAGIEVSAFFIVGAPGESAFEVEASIEFALELDPDFVIVTRMQYWPGTDLYEEHRERLDFSLAPTRCEPHPAAGIPSYEQTMAWEQAFYRRFYLRPWYMARRVSTFARTPADVLEGLGRLGAFIARPGARRDFI